jgi:hypothetical protein
MGCAGPHGRAALAYVALRCHHVQIQDALDQMPETGCSGLAAAADFERAIRTEGDVLGRGTPTCERATDSPGACEVVLSQLGRAAARR